MNYTNELGEFLKTRRGALGLTQRALAQKLGVEASYVELPRFGGRRRACGKSF